MKYGRLTIVSEERDKDHKVLCVCDCGVKKKVTIFNLKSGNTSSCGCLRREKMKEAMKVLRTGKKPSNYVDFTGKRIGFIQVLRRVKDVRKHTSTYECQCDCGQLFVTEISTLRRCKYMRCECGPKNHPLKNKLQKMIDRCEDPSEKSYSYYGEKGIKVCDEWKKFPIKFIKWAMETGWEPHLTIDRIDSKMDYCPENCHWITHSDNSKKAMNDRWSKRKL